MKKLKSIFTTLSLRVSGVYLFILLLGALFGVFFSNFHYFVFETTIKITDLLSAVLTVFVGIYIASKIQSQVSSDRIEKDLIISELKEIKISVNKLTDLVEIRTIGFNELVRLNKQISQNISLTLKLVAHCKYDNATFNSLKAILVDFRLVNRKLTILLPIEEVITLSHAQSYELSSKLKLIHEKIMLQIISINRI